MKRLGQEIGKHALGFTMSQGDVVGTKTVSDPEVTNVDMSGALTGGSTAIALKFNGTFVVLFEKTVGDGIPLVGALRRWLGTGLVGLPSRRRDHSFP